MSFVISSSSPSGSTTKSNLLSLRAIRQTVSQLCRAREYASIISGDKAVAFLYNRSISRTFALCQSVKTSESILASKSEIKFDVISSCLKTDNVASCSARTSLAPLGIIVWLSQESKASASERLEILLNFFSNFLYASSDSILPVVSSVVIYDINN